MAYRAVTIVGNTVTLYNKETKEDMTITVTKVNGHYYNGSFEYQVEGSDEIHSMTYKEYGSNYDVVL